MLEEQVHIAVRADLYVADACEAGEQLFLIDESPVCDPQAIEGAGSQTPHDQVVLPSGKCRAPVELEARDRRRRCEVDDRLFGVFEGEVEPEVLPDRDGFTVIVESIGEQRPAVVAAANNEIHFVAASRPHFGSPDLPGRGV